MKVNILKRKIEFLNTLLYKEKNDHLHTTLYKQPNDRQNYSHSKLEHSYALKKGIAFSQVLRINRIWLATSESQNTLRYLEIDFWVQGCQHDKENSEKCSKRKGKSRSSHQSCSIKKVFLKISQNSQENTSARVPF